MYHIIKKAETHISPYTLCNTQDFLKSSRKFSSYNSVLRLLSNVYNICQSDTPFCLMFFYFLSFYWGCPWGLLWFRQRHKERFRTGSVYIECPVSLSASDLPNHRLSWRYHHQFVWRLTQHNDVGVQGRYGAMSQVYLKYSNLLSMGLILGRWLVSEPSTFWTTEESGTITHSVLNRKSRTAFEKPIH